MSYLLRILSISLSILLLVDADINPLCNCYQISLQSVSGMSVDQTICYTYSIQYNLENQGCEEYDAVSMILGVCDNQNEGKLTHKTLEESIISISPEQYASKSWKSSQDSLLGLKLENLISSWIDERVTICMNHINIDGFTSNNIQFILNNNDIITCFDDPNQNGLPCNEAATTGTVQKIDNNNNNNMETKDGLNKRLKISEVLKYENKALSIETREYIKYVFIGIMIFIALNAMCCTLLALRQSGALDKYFDEIQDDLNDIISDTEIDGDTTDENIDIHDQDIDDDINDDIDIDYIDDSAINHISFSELVAIRNNDDNMQKLQICVSQWDNQQNSQNSPFKE